MTSQDSRIAADRAYIESLLDRYSPLRSRINQALLIALHSRGIITLDEIHAEARRRCKLAARDHDDDRDDNVQQVRRWDKEERRTINELTLDYAAQHIPREELDDLVNITRKREEAQTLEEVANLSAVSFSLLAEKVKSFCRLPKGQTRLSENESMAARVALIRSFISDQLRYIGVAKRYLRIRDFDDLVDRIIADDSGAGVIGGKAGGMLLGARILAATAAADPRAPKVEFTTPETFYLRSDVIERFLQHNGLHHLQDHKYKSIDEIRNEYPMILDLFKNADFPDNIVEKIRDVLSRAGNHPLIVRSSSLLEDRFETAFAGKYRSVFVSNQGTPEERLDELLGAIAEVYASSLHPDPISYRLRHDLLDYNENMAVMIQKLVGTRVGRYFLPVWAGVGFSHNPYRRNTRVRPEDGLARVVFGLGTRAVDRVASDFPRMIALGLPAMRAESTPEEVMRASQKKVDVIDIEKNTFASVPVEELLAMRPRMDGMNLVFSVMENGYLRPQLGDHMPADPRDTVVTFDRFAQSSSYPGFLRWALQALEKAYGCPVDIEFAFDGKTFHLLQCRPQAMPRKTAPVSLPTGVPPQRKIFSADRDVAAASVHDIEYVVLIDPRDYDRVESPASRRGVGRIVHRLNQALAGRRFILMGPGRWGSKDLKLGVRISYSDINNTAMLIEIARRRDDFLPEVSYGSHFFQDLVESDIRYLALFPDEPGALFNETFLNESPNALETLLPDAAAEYGDVVRVVHVPTVAGGALLNVDMDGESQQALAWLPPGTDRS